MTVRLQILGPLRVWRDGAEQATGPQQQALLLGVLLARVGQPVSTSELIDLIWNGNAPASALNVVQKYVGALRRLLEPTLSARESGAFLHRREQRYWLRADRSTLDLVAFREQVRTAKAGVGGDEAALDAYAEALSRWQGPAGEGLRTGSAAAAVFGALDREFFDACTAAAVIAVTSDGPERVLRPLQLAVLMDPLNEPVQAGLVEVLAAAGRPAEALAAFQRARTRLGEDLGVTPGPALLAAHRRALAHSSGPVTVGAPARGADASGRGEADGVVGRADELTLLRRAAESALTGDTGLVLVEGEPGVGKTRLLRETAAQAARRGALVAWGQCSEGGAAPSMWPWIQIVGAVLDDLPASVRAEWTDGDLSRLVHPLDAPTQPDAAAQFRLFEEVVAVLGDAATRRPLLIVIDDLQWADPASLRLLGHLVDRPTAGLALIGALRDRAPAPAPDLTRMLASVSRAHGHWRLPLGPLGPDDVAELVRRTTGRDPAPAEVRTIHARTGGNAFFVRELSRVLADTGASPTRAEVPATVLDMVRHRLTGLDDEHRELLRIAALVGRDIGVDLFSRIAGLDVPACLERLEDLRALGLLAPTPGSPFSYGFAHDLARESVASAVPRPQALRLHLRIADAWEDTASGGETAAESIAHHLWAAGPLADPARTADALIRAGRRAVTKAALEAAEPLFRSAVQVARAADRPELELAALSRLIAVVAVRSGYLRSAVDLLERAEHLARELGLERTTAEIVFAQSNAYCQCVELTRSGQLARRLLAEGTTSTDPVVRTYALQSWGIHNWALGDINEAYSYLSRTGEAIPDDLASRETELLRHDLQMYSAGLLAETSALHGRVDEARAILGRMEAAAGQPYLVTIWSTFAARTATLIGDPDWALRAAERGIAADPERASVFYDINQRLARCWARAVTGHDPARAAAEAERIITESLLDPPRSGLVAWLSALSEMWLAAGRTDEAAGALDRAGQLLDTHGQRYAEGHVLVQRVRVMQARGEPAALVRAAAERARALSAARGAHLFSGRAEQILGGQRAS
ncbi:ATP-binding protein [Cryptosporangium sp. NPDC051539]|uniref:ATP-binding protein n=1 Tax=Cryptosporangium sp. NPDC051539 TaxID=3363962 RepID=UPI00378B956A